MIGVGSPVDDDTAGSEDVAPSGNIDLSCATSAVSAARGSQSPAGNEVRKECSFTRETFVVYSFSTRLLELEAPVLCLYSFSRLQNRFKFVLQETVLKKGKDCSLCLNLAYTSCFMIHIFLECHHFTDKGREGVSQGAVEVLSVRKGRK